MKKRHANPQFPPSYIANLGMKKDDPKLLAACEAWEDTIFKAISQAVDALPLRGKPMSWESVSWSHGRRNVPDGTHPDDQAYILVRRGPKRVTYLVVGHDGDRYLAGCTFFGRQSDLYPYRFPCLDQAREVGLSEDRLRLEAIAAVEKALADPPKKGAVTVLNLTPHPISFCDESGTITRTLAPENPTPPRVSSTLVEREPIDGIPFAETVFGEVENLPQPQAGVVLVVSAFVLSACQGRTDLVRPDTGADCLRDDKGRILAVRRLTR